MKYRTYFTRISCLILTCLLLCSSAFAVNSIDTGRTGSLTVEYQRFADVEFSLYRVAEVSAAGKLTLTGDFTRYPVSVNGLNSSGWEALANTLTTCVRMDGLQALETGKTNASGKLTFNALQTGLYLIIGERHTGPDGWTYTPKPFLVVLPGRTVGGNSWNYDVTAAPKYSREPVPPSGSTVSIKALKGWDDAGYEDKRPACITLHLLQDGTVYETVSVTKADNWTYLWSDLDAAYSWTVMEEPIGDYTISIRQEGDTFIIINTYDDTPAPPGPGPGDPDTPDDPNDPFIPIDPDNPGSGGGEGEPEEDQPDVPKLPQTGMLWWPVPLLAGAGLILFILGFIRYKNAEDE